MKKAAHFLQRVSGNCSLETHGGRSGRFRKALGDGNNADGEEHRIGRATPPRDSGAGCQSIINLEHLPTLSSSSASLLLNALSEQRSPFSESQGCRGSSQRAALCARGRPCHHHACVRVMLALTGKPSRAKPGIELRGLDITLAFMPLSSHPEEGLARLFRQAKSVAQRGRRSTTMK